MSNWVYVVKRINNSAPSPTFYNIHDVAAYLIGYEYINGRFSAQYVIQKIDRSKMSGGDGMSEMSEDDKN